MIPLTDNGKELGVQEWRDSLFLHYVIEPPDLTSNCDGCGAAFTICHDLECKKGGLIMEHQHNIRDGVTDLAGKAFTPAHVCDDTKIFPGSAVRGGKAKAKGKPAAKGKEAPTP